MERKESLLCVVILSIVLGTLDLWGQGEDPVREIRLNPGYNENLNVFAAGQLSNDQPLELLLQDTLYRRTFICQFRTPVKSKEMGELSVLYELPALDEYINSGDFADLDGDARAEILLLTNRFLYIFENPNDVKELRQVKRWNIYDMKVEASALNANEVTRTGRAPILKDSEKRGLFVLVADATNDGQDDIIFSKYQGRTEGFSHISLTILSQGDADFEPVIELTSPGTGWEGFQILDLNRDGKNELVLATQNAVAFRQFDPLLDDFRLESILIELYPGVAGQRLWIEAPNGRQTQMFHLVTEFQRAQKSSLLNSIIVFDVPAEVMARIAQAKLLAPDELNVDSYLNTRFVLSSADLHQNRIIPLAAEKGAMYRSMFMISIKPAEKQYLILNTDAGCFLLPD